MERPHVRSCLILQLMNPQKTFQMLDRHKNNAPLVRMHIGAGSVFPQINPQPDPPKP